MRVLGDPNALFSFRARCWQTEIVWGKSQQDNRILFSNFFIFFFNLDVLYVSKHGILKFHITILD